MASRKTYSYYRYNLSAFQGKLYFLPNCSLSEFNVATERYDPFCNSWNSLHWTFSQLCPSVTLTVVGEDMYALFNTDYSVETSQPEIEG